ncbi:phospholipase [Niastella caeni]|uniref:Phospholipase n=1 Tax=Niastella caeni TaxID=2569763 RepID=A0A4S8HRN9_9BACT|nr:prolyl oligopeptidase family serine peptidase [Niastella caeni]THU38110.1 phospholipase [Niastella caeni]
MKYIALFRHLFLPLLLAVAIQQSHAQRAFVHKEYSEANYEGMRYGLFTPANYDSKRSYPLVVYLHGSGDTTSWDHNFYQDSLQKAQPCFVLTPKCLNPNQGWGNSWFTKHADAMAKTLPLIDDLIKQYSIDTTRLYILGLSMGGFGVFSVLAKNPGKFAAAYAICGGANPLTAARVMRTPLWIFHGAEDDVVPVHLSRNIYEAIIKLGGKKTKYTEYPGVKHNSWENVGRESALLPWLFSQRLQGK